VERAGRGTRRSPPAVGVGQRRALRSTRPAVPHEQLRGQERSLRWKVEALEGVVGKRRFDLLDAFEADRHLGVDDGVDRHERTVCG